MGADAEEGLAHDDKRRDIEDKWVEREAQSAEEMGEEHHPLTGPWGGDELPLFGKPVRDVVRQVSGLPQFFDVSLRDGGDHPLASHSGHGRRRLRWGVRTWALELECEEMDWQRRKKAWMRKVDPYPLIWADATTCPHPPGKTRLSPER